MNSHIFCGQLNQRNDVIKNPFICVTCPLFVWIQRCNDVLLLSPKILWTKAHSFSIHSEQLYKSNGRNYRIHLQCWDTRWTNFLFKFIFCSHVKKIFFAYVWISWDTSGQERFVFNKQYQVGIFNRFWYAC